MTPSNGNVFMQDVVDRGPWLFYDRLQTAQNTNTANRYDFFNIPLGGTKTKSDTNLQMGNRLPPPQAFSMSHIGFIFAATMLFADLAGFLKNYYFELRIGTKVFAEGPLHLFPGGAGIAGFAATNHATPALIQAVNNGDPSLLSTRRFPDYPRIIPANVYFGLTVFQGAAVVALAATVGATVVSPAYGGLDVMAVVDGVYDREVQ